MGLNYHYKEAKKRTKLILASLCGDCNDCTRMIEVFTTTLLNICNKHTLSFNQKKYRLHLHIKKKLNMC